MGYCRIIIPPQPFFRNWVYPRWLPGADDDDERVKIYSCYQNVQYHTYLASGTIYHPEKTQRVLCAITEFQEQKKGKHNSCIHSFQRTCSSIRIDTAHSSSIACFNLSIASLVDWKLGKVDNPRVPSIISYHTCRQFTYRREYKIKIKKRREEKWKEKKTYRQKDGMEWNWIE